MTFKVLDAMDAPHGGRILKLRFQSGEAPRVRELRGAEMEASSPDGSERRSCRISGFALFGGKPTDERLARTGRIDVHIDDDPAVADIDLTWTLSGPTA